MAQNIFFITLNYFLGSIPFGVWIAKVFYNVDIREHGSKNTGATNVWRVLGWKPGLCTFVLDFLKGFAPTWVVLHFGFGTVLSMFAGLATIIGHNWSIFLKGKGGKGVATSAGVFIALMPIQTSIAILVFLIVFGINKRISVGSMAAALALVISTFAMKMPNAYRWLSILVSLMILIKHIPNMKRLMQGQEPKVNI